MTKDESDGDFLARIGTDGQKWAREFLAMDFAPDDIDEGLMIGWFANAIEAGREAGHRAALAASPPKLESGTFAWTATSGYRFYPAYVNLTGNRLSVRGPEVDGKMGHHAVVELPDDAIADLRPALTASPPKVPRDGAATIGKTQSFSIGATPAPVESDAFVMPTGLANNRTWGERPASVESGVVERVRQWADYRFGNLDKPGVWHGLRSDDLRALLALATSGEVTEAMIEAGVIYISNGGSNIRDLDWPNYAREIYLAMCAAR